MKLKDEFGIWRSEVKEIAGIIKTHFQSLYSAPPSRNFDDVLSLIDHIVTPEINESLVKTILYDEICLATFQMGPLKAPGSDAFPGLFFQKYWEVVGDDLVEAVQSFFQNGVLTKELNHTNVTLVPKVRYPEAMSQFHPISLCRFI